MSDSNVNVSLSISQGAAIEALIARAKAKAEERKNEDSENSSDEKDSEDSDADNSEEIAAHSKQTESDKAAKKEERVAAKVLRDAEREAKKAAKILNKVEKVAKKAEKSVVVEPKHMLKVLKSGASLPKMNDVVQNLFNECTLSGTSESDLTVLSAHLAYFIRMQSTLRSAKSEVVLQDGQHVKIVSGDPKLIGKIGVISSVRKIRVLVTIEGMKNDAYLFTSDVQVVENVQIDENFESIQTSEEVAETQTIVDAETSEESIPEFFEIDSNDNVLKTITECSKSTKSNTM